MKHLCFHAIAYRQILSRAEQIAKRLLVTFEILRRDNRFEEPASHEVGGGPAEYFLGSGVPTGYDAFGVRFNDGIKREFENSPLLGSRFARFLSTHSAETACYAWQDGLVLF